MIKSLDVSGYSEEDKYRVVSYAFESLDLGEKMLLTDNQEPGYLHNQFNEAKERQYELEYIEQGPEQWKVSLSKKYLNFI